MHISSLEKPQLKYIFAAKISISFFYSTQFWQKTTWMKANVKLDYLKSLEPGFWISVCVFFFFHNFQLSFKKLHFRQNFKNPSHHSNSQYIFKIDFHIESKGSYPEPIIETKFYICLNFWSFGTFDHVFEKSQDCGFS